MKSFKKYVESAKKITEASTRDDYTIELGNTSGVLKLVPGDGMFLEMWAGGNGFRNAWKNKDFTEKLDELRKTQDKDLRAELEKEMLSLRNDILKAADNFDREIEKAMNKHGFRK